MLIDEKLQKIEDEIDELFDKYKFLSGLHDLIHETYNEISELRDGVYFLPDDLLIDKYVSSGPRQTEKLDIIVLVNTTILLFNSVVTREKLEKNTAKNIRLYINKVVEEMKRIDL